MDPSQLPPQPAQPIPPQPPQPTPVTEQQAPRQPQPPTPMPTPGQPAQPPTMQPGMPAFMYPQANLPNQQPAAPRKSRKGLIIIVLVLLVLAGGGGAAFLALHKKTPASPVQPPHNPSTPSENQEVIKLTDSVKLAEAPSLVVPDSLDGWTPDTKAAADNPGLIHTGGCKMYYSVGVARKTDGVPDDKATDTTIAADIDRLKATNNVSEITYGQTTMAIANSNKRLEFKTAAFEYADQTFDIIVTARRIDGYLLGIRFYCPRAAFSVDLNQQLLDKLTINLKESS